MKKSIHLLLFTSILLFGCQNTKLSLSTSKERTQEKVGTIALYYELIHEAELALIRDQYEAAVEYYLAAREENPLFTKDAENALLIAIEVENYTAAAIFASNLLQKGVPKTYFQQRKFFQAFVKSEEWLGLKAEEGKQFNLDLKERLAELLRMDQKYRYDDFYADSMILIDSIVKGEILAVFEQYGYPNSSVIGVSMRNDTTIDRDQFKLLLLPQIPPNRALFLPLLEAFLEQGQLSKHFFEAHRKILYPSDEFELSCLGGALNLFIQVEEELYTCCCEAEARIDSTRKRFYLEPLSEVRLKAEFHYERDRRFGFGGCTFKYKLRQGEERSKVKSELAKQGFVLHKKLDNDRAYSK